MTEYHFPKPGWVMTHEKRAWVPEWLYRAYSRLLPPWLEPFRWILNRKVQE